VTPDVKTLPPLDFTRFDALTFDCYGTLIDWEAGILSALRPLLEAHGIVDRDDDDLLERHAQLEAEAEEGPFRRYRSILAEVARGFGEDFGFVPTSAQVEGFAASVAVWPPFEDSTQALKALETRYRLAIVSNVDDDLFAGSAGQLGIDFSEVVTAQQVGSYKPAQGHFDEVLLRLELPRSRVLHVAQSLYHDIAPARQLGFTCVWVNRRVGRPGGGATQPATAHPDHEVPDLRTLVEQMGL
jgi:2-haloacid dehalogenase